MALTTAKKQISLLYEIKIVDFKERPICHACKGPMIICSHSTPSPVIGFEGLYYTEYIEYTCGDSDCTHYKKKKYRAPNPWRVDRHRYDCEVEAAVVHHHFKEQKTYQEIEMFMKLQYGMKISQRTIGNIINRYEIACKLAQAKHFSTEFKKNGGIFIGVDTMAPLKGEDKHIVAIDHYTCHTLLVERVKSENTDNHVAFQKKLKKLTRRHKIRVFGFMSDDHVAQRKAIRTVWGPKMKHCRCLFHFQKRIMLESFKLNSRVKTEAIARIRDIHYIQLFREEKLKSVEASEVWQFLVEIIKDLTALQYWKIKRNDTDLESIILYERIHDIFALLKALKDYFASTFKATHKVEKQCLAHLMKEVKVILTDFKQSYEDLVRIRGYQLELKRILEAHEESSKEGLEKLGAFAEGLESRLNVGEVTCDAEKFYIEQLCSFVSDRGESLFQYRNIKNANNTNNIQETKFKRLKHGVRRTQGTATGARYFQNHAKYLLYVDQDATQEEIRQILLQADYKAIAKIMKEDRALRKNPLSRVKDKERWKARKKELKEKLQEFKISL
jgi:hypothetical protein